MWWEGMAAVISRLQRDKHPPHQAAGSQSTFAKRRRLMGWSRRWALTSIRTPLMCALTLATLGVVCFDTCHTLPLCVALNSAGSFFFPSYSWMMRQNVGDTASCWESALPLHCRHFRRESVSPSAYIYISLYCIYIHSSEMYTSGKNKLLREKQTQRLNGRRLLPQTGESWTVTRLESACISCKYHILHNSEVGYILTKYNHRWLHLPGGVLHSTCSLFSESKQSQVALCCRRLLVLVSLRLHEWIQTFRLFGPWKKTETQFSLLFFFDAVVSFSSTKQVIWEQNPPQTSALPGWKHSDWIPNVHPLDFQTAPWWSSDVSTVTCSLSRMSSLQGCETAGI